MSTQKKQVKSVESQVTAKIHDWFNKMKVKSACKKKFFEKNKYPNTLIEEALKKYASKSGGAGGNYPDFSCLIKSKYNKIYPIVIECKGYKDKLVKLDSNDIVENTDDKNQLNVANIKNFAVNGAVHYATAILHHTNYENVIAIGITGYEDDNKLKTLIEVYYVGKDNFAKGRKVGSYDDLSFLSDKYFDKFIDNVEKSKLTNEEREKLKEKIDSEIQTSLVKLNNDIYKNEDGLIEKDRIYLVAASIIATIGVKNGKGGYEVSPLDIEELKCIDENGRRDGDIVLTRIKNFFASKSEIPVKKREQIIGRLKTTLKAENLNKVKNGETQLKRVFTKIIDSIGLYYKFDVSLDFTGKLFNEMYNWLGFTQDKLNDVVLTPSYIAKLLVKLCKVDMNSYVWDFATGSAGLLVAAMNEMIADAKDKIKSPSEFMRKERQIKAEQLLGLEILDEIYMLAIINMILMGDGSSNILNNDSLNDFDGKYAYGKTNKKFKANAFVLNPPYSKEGNGMIFVKKALSMMDKGYAAIIIQSSAGTGKATTYNQEILKNNTLIASIKMPTDLFIGKSSVQTNIYVFKVGEPHKENSTVRFIDFTDDGYTRTNRKKASINLKDTGHAKEKYEELVELVHNGYKKGKKHFINESCFYEDEIDPTNGNDWNKTAPIDTKPTLDDFKKTVSDYLSFEVSTLLKSEKESLGKK